ncbi:MAG: PorV/PorQ family protein [Acidobacteriota bacterium]
MKTEKFILLLICLMCCANASWGQNNFKKIGTAGYVFLEIPVTARGAAMGEATLTTLQGALSVFDNPAATGLNTDRHSFGASFADWFAETQHKAAAYSYNGADLGVFTVSAVQLDYGTMQGTISPSADATGSYIITDDFSADGLALGVSYARQMTDKFSFGATVKYVREKISVYKSDNMLFDAGIYYSTGYHSLRIGGALKNFGVDAKYLQGLFKMPTEFRLGASMDAFGSEASDHRLTLAVEATHPSDNDERFNVGGEYWFQNFVALRGGYKFNYDEEKWTAGAGVRWSGLTLDAAYASYGRLGTVVRFSLSAGI